MCGAVSNPDKEYHIEIAAPTEEFAQFVIGMMNYFEISAKMTCRKAKYVVYLKRAEEISSVLTLLGASNSVMHLENVRILKDVSNQVNRQMNCDTFNINRTMNAAESQIQDILYLDEEIGLDKLPLTLREVAEVRINHPETSLSGLGELLNPPIGKSGVNGRLRKLSELARKLRAGEDTGLE
jgi:DNA-binding protein WhiA